MDSVFPFGLPGPTASYLVLYLATFALHQAFMHYVLAGSFYLAWCNLFPGEGVSLRTEQPVARCLREWMPFALSAAITAGVAPLLFIQIVYPKAFYTANLLLSWRWMIVIPVLIVVFYLLYLVKSRRCLEWSAPVRTSLSLLVAVSCLFVGFCWTANHLISMNESSWPEIYQSGSVGLSFVEVVLRTLVWCGGAVPTMAVFVSWQLELYPPADSSDDVAHNRVRLAKWSLVGLMLSLLASIVYLCWMNSDSRELILSSFALPYLIVAGLGAVLQGFAWGQILKEYGRMWLVSASLGCLLSLLGLSVVREAIRLSQLDITQLFSDHTEAGNIGGLSVFLVFTVLNVGVIGYCVVLVKRGISRES